MFSLILSGPPCSAACKYSRAVMMARGKDRLIVTDRLFDQSLGSTPFCSSSGPADKGPGQSPGLDSGISTACKYTETDAQSSCQSVKPGNCLPKLGKNQQALKVPGIKVKMDWTQGASQRLAHLSCTEHTRLIVLFALWLSFSSTPDVAGKETGAFGTH